MKMIKSAALAILFTLAFQSIALSQCWELIYQAGEGVRFERIIVAQDSSVWVYGNNQQHNSIFRSVDSGNSWQAITIPYDDIEGLFAIDKNKAWAFSRFFNSFYVFTTEDGGQNWEINEFDQIQALENRSIHIADESSGWATYRGKIVRITEGGTQAYCQLDLGFNTVRLDNVLAKDSLTGWISGKWTSTPNYGVLLHTKDGGESWATLIEGIRPIWDFDVLADSLIWAVAEKNIVYKSTDGGQNWDTYPILDDGSCCADYEFFCCPTFFPTSVDFVNDSLGWAAYHTAVVDSVITRSSHVVVSRDGGLSWKKHNIDIVGGPKLFMLSDTSGYLLTSGNPSTGIGNPYNQVYRFSGRPAECGPLASVFGDSTLLPKLEWTAAQGCFDGYMVKIGTTPGAEDVLPATDVGTTTAYQVLSPLPPGAQLYATIVPYNHIFGAAEGCGSTTFTTISCPPPIEVDTGFCKGGSIAWEDMTISEPGTYTYSEPLSTGCSLQTVLQVEQYEDYAVSIDTALCEGESFFWQDSLLPAPGFYQFEYATAQGCDSTVNIHLEELQRPGSRIDTFFCEGVPYQGQDTTIWQAGVYEFLYSNAAGCDSTLELYLAERPNVYTEVDTVLLPGTTYGGVLVESDTSFTLNFPAANGCDSIVTVKIEILVGTSRPLPAGWKVYPNPANSMLYIEAAAPLREIALASLAGKTLLSQATPSYSAVNTYTLSLEGLPAGVYLLRLRGLEGSWVRKIVVQRF